VNLDNSGEWEEVDLRADTIAVPGALAGSAPMVAGGHAGRGKARKTMTKTEEIT
jgi:hypothetical protein